MYVYQLHTDEMVCHVFWLYHPMDLCKVNTLHDHEETILVFFRSWSRYFSFIYLHVFFDKLLNKLLWLFCLFVPFIPDGIAFSSIPRIKTIFCGHHSILCEKNLS